MLAGFPRFETYTAPFASVASWYGNVYPVVISWLGTVAPGG